ncbi:MAG TPA: hypothetical protein PL098_00015 [Brevundimonas diminuta]|nr:hypothetical protein [Brevundimonas diminuta]HRL23288.1 hypothetical protein [Brevundimonas diminuta]
MSGPREDLAGKLKAIRDKFLMPTPDKDFTDYAAMTRCTDALSAAQPPAREDAQPVAKPAPEGGAEWFGVTGAVDETEALAVALFDARCPGIRMTDEDMHYYRAAAQRAMQAVTDELDTPALATREEAPAEAGEDVNWKAEYEAVCEARISDRQKSQEVINERDKWVVELLQERAALRAQPPARSGKVTWHSSGEDEGPDVGMQLDLGHGRSLWLGEGQKPTGWQFSLVHGDDIIPVADVIDHDQARDLFDLIASAVQPQAREDAQPFMFAYEDVDKPGDWRAFRHQIRRTDGSICPGRALYTHPAPDALRNALADLIENAVAARGCGLKNDPDGIVSSALFDTIMNGRAALATLQAEQGAK